LRDKVTLVEPLGKIELLCDFSQILLLIILEFLCIMHS